jgi:uncharacterized protein YbjQ (UPF0145 family)
MGLFSSRNDPAAPTQASSVAAGEVPQQALERLRSMKGAGGKPAFFTSDLSVNEFALVKQAGFDPLGMVVGSSIYHIGYQRGQWTQSQELNVLSQAMYHARELAMTRMEEEADALGADGIVGVRLDIGRYEWGESLAEFIAVGTAVKSRDGQSHRTIENKPFTSDLSGQDLFVLRKSGYRPVALVMGSCVYHVAHLTMRQAWKTLNTNIEMGNFTQSLYDARELAMGRMQAEAVHLKAEGIVGVNLVQRSHGWESHVIEFFAVGTAVVPAPGAVVAAEPSLTLSVNDPSP